MQLISNVKSYMRRVTDAKLARAEGYAEGVDESTKRLAPKLSSLTERIGDLTRENINMEANLRKTYDERIAILESRQTKNCRDCMGLTESERERLRGTQNTLLDLLQRFNMVFMKVFKHTNLVGDEHDTILKSSSRIKASRDILLQIRSEADDIIKKALPLLSITATEGSSIETNPKELQVVKPVEIEEDLPIKKDLPGNGKNPVKIEISEA